MSCIVEKKLDRTSNRYYDIKRNSTKSDSVDIHTALDNLKDSRSTFIKREPRETEREREILLRENSRRCVSPPPKIRR